MMEFALRKQGLYDADLEGRTRTNYCVQTSKVTKDSQRNEKTGLL